VRLHLARPQSRLERRRSISTIHPGSRTTPSILTAISSAAAMPAPHDRATLGASRRLDHSTLLNRARRCGNSIFRRQERQRIRLIPNASRHASMGRAGAALTNMIYDSRRWPRTVIHRRRRRKSSRSRATSLRPCSIPTRTLDQPLDPRAPQWHRSARSERATSIILFSTMRCIRSKARANIRRNIPAMLELPTWSARWRSYVARSLAHDVANRVF